MPKLPTSALETTKLFGLYLNITMQKSDNQSLWL